MRRNRHRTSMLPPPAAAMTPTSGLDWLQRVYPRLGAFAGLGYYDGALRPPREREELRGALASLSIDVRSIAMASIEAIATGKSVPIELDPWPSMEAAHKYSLGSFRKLIRFEKRYPHRIRGVLREGLREWERFARERR